MALAAPLAQFADLCRDLKAVVTEAAITHFLSKLDWGKTLEETHAGIAHIQETFKNEMGTRLFLFIDPSGNEYYEDPLALFPKTASGFQSCVQDIEEACKCYALDQGTAAVFHIMRCLEATCEATARSLDPAMPNMDGWGNYAKYAEERIEGKVKAFTLPAHWSSSKSFYEEVLADLKAMYRAWRNPTMHMEKHYGPKRARAILEAACALMEHIATHVDENGAFTP